MPSVMTALLLISTLLVVGSAVNCRPDRFLPFLPFPSFPRFNFNLGPRFQMTTTLQPPNNGAVQPMPPVNPPMPPMETPPPEPQRPDPRQPPSPPLPGSRLPPRLPPRGPPRPNPPPMEQTPPMEQNPPMDTTGPFTINETDVTPFPDFGNTTINIMTRIFPTCAEYGCSAGQGCDHATKSCRQSVIDI